MCLREKMANIYKQLPVIFNDFSKTLAAIIAAKSFLITNQNVMTCLVIMIAVYFLVLVIGTVLQLYITNHHFFIILSCIMLLLASAASVLALIVIETTIAFIIAILWVSAFISVAIFHRHELCDFKSYLTRKVNSLIWSENPQSARPRAWRYNS